MSLVFVDDLVAFIYKYSLFKQIPALGPQEWLDIGTFINVIHCQTDSKRKAATKKRGSFHKILVEITGRTHPKHILQRIACSKTRE